MSLRQESCSWGWNDNDPSPLPPPPYRRTYSLYYFTNLLSSYSLSQGAFYPILSLRPFLKQNALQFLSRIKIHNRIEQNRIEQNRIEQNRIEQNRIEQNRIEQNRIEQNRIEQNRIEQKSTLELHCNRLCLIHLLGKYLATKRCVHSPSSLQARQEF